MEKLLLYFFVVSLGLVTVFIVSYLLCKLGRAFWNVIDFIMFVAREKREEGK